MELGSIGVFYRIQGVTFIWFYGRIITADKKKGERKKLVEFKECSTNIACTYIGNNLSVSDECNCCNM